jgi:ABC-type uncharacterized transport system permease subunit
MKRRHPLLSGPYLIWTAAFIVIPLVMNVYYGLTDETGAFTWSNVLQMGTPERMKALILSLILSLSPSSFYYMNVCGYLVVHTCVPCSPLLIGTSQISLTHGPF